MRNSVPLLFVQEHYNHYRKFFFSKIIIYLTKDAFYRFNLINIVGFWNMEGQSNQREKIKFGKFSAEAKNTIIGLDHKLGHCKFKIDVRIIFSMIFASLKYDVNW